MPKKHLLLLLVIVIAASLMLAVCWYANRTTTPAATTTSPSPVAEMGLPVQPAYGTIVGKVQTGAQLGVDYCAAGLYLTYSADAAGKPVRERRLLKMRDRQGAAVLFAENAFVGKQVSVGVSEEDATSVTCKAATCECERSLFIESMAEEEVMPLEAAH